jgi:hypothetical protein
LRWTIGQWKENLMIKEVRYFQILHQRRESEKKWDPLGISKDVGVWQAGCVFTYLGARCIKKGLIGWHDAIQYLGWITPPPSLPPRTPLITMTHAQCTYIHAPVMSYGTAGAVATNGTSLDIIIYSEVTLYVWRVKVTTLRLHNELRKQLLPGGNCKSHNWINNWPERTNRYWWLTEARAASWGS